jgi:hypothetical protein
MKSKFSDLLKPSAKEPSAKAKPGGKSSKKARAAVAVASAVVETETRQVISLRTVGKRSKADYTQVTAYIPKKTHKDVKLALLDDGRDFSDLVSELLAEWVKSVG